MEDLARKLCEAVENEDAREVENLLKYGADPNLVLSNGIAAIHLASGKESECALRCLTMILQHGGNPNVRSTDDLTPVHVAAAWGCCKALIFLLLKGGDPSVQDQDENTALDLALMENNRRCVVALQEYNERISGCADENRACYKDYSSLPDIAALSCVTLLLESTYKNSPLSSTKTSPMMQFPKTVTLGDHPANKVISSQVEMPVLRAKDESSKEQEFCHSCKITRNECALKPAKAKVLVPFASQSCHCSEYFSTHGESDITLDNLTMSEQINTDVSIKSHCLVDGDWKNNAKTRVNEEKTLKTPPYLALQPKLKCNRKLALNHGVTDFQVSRKLEGLDETSPDHDYTYNKDHNDEEMENAMITCGSNSDTEKLKQPETYSKSKYSDYNTSLWGSGHGTLLSDTLDNSFRDCNWGKEDARILSNKLPHKTMNAQSSGTVDTWNKDMQAVERKELTDICTQIISDKNRTLTVQNINKNVSTSEMQCTSQSSTLPVETTNFEPGSQNLEIHLKNLLLSTKGCHRTVSEAVGSFTTPVKGETKSLQCGHAFNQTLKDVISSSASSESIFTVESHENHVTEKGDTDLQENLKTLMLTTKNFYSPDTANEDKSPFFTPRTKNRLNSFKLCQNISSLFEDSMGRLKQGKRVRSREGLLALSTTDLLPDEFLPRRNSNCPSLTNELIKVSDTPEELCENVMKKLPVIKSTNEIPQNHGENLSEPEATLCTNNFLTDDFSSETDDKSCLQLKQSASKHCSDDGISAWLTEDGESENSAVADHERNFSSSTEEKSGPASLFNGSFFHSTVTGHTAVSSCKVPRYSFSRLSSIPKADESTLKLCPSIVCESAKQEVPLSPGGRPVNVSQVDSVEYLYKDNEKGHVLIEKHIPTVDQSDTVAAGKSPNTIIYNWKNCKINTITTKKATAINAPNRVAVELYRLSNDDIASRLRGIGIESGEITSQNRKMWILLLDRHLKEQTSNGPAGLSFEYSPDLSLALRTFNLPDCSKDEAELSREFDQPDKTQKWREGVLKSSFNYLLLDPRVTRNLPSRSRGISQLDCFRTFVSSIFYVGKGKQSRPYCHLYEALNQYNGNCKPLCSKTQHIIDIWKSGQGVLSLHCFQNTIPVEAYTREACMVDAIGLKMLTNQKKGVYYGQVQSWSPTRRRSLGVDMLYKAMQIFLAEGERQLRPPDIRSGH